MENIIKDVQELKISLALLTQSQTTFNNHLTTLSSHMEKLSDIVPELIKVNQTLVSLESKNLDLARQYTQTQQSFNKLQDEIKDLDVLREKINLMQKSFMGFVGLIVVSVSTAVFKLVIP